MPVFGLSRWFAAWMAGLVLALSLAGAPAWGLPTTEVMVGDSGHLLTPELVYWHEPEGSVDATEAYARIDSLYGEIEKQGIAHLEKECSYVKVLGSYPKAE